jgi:FeS assembly protein IscX
MPKELTWSDAEDIGILLSEAHPQLDPLAVRFTDLHKYVIALPGFKDDPAKSNEAKLEAILRWRGTRKFSTEPKDNCLQGLGQVLPSDGRPRPSRTQTTSILLDRM